jgi:hypothetical protein
MRARTSLQVAPRNWAHATGAIAWGRDATPHYLFASSEPSGKDDPKGCHRAFDLEKLKMAYKFDANEAGDAMALDGNGANISTGLFVVRSSLSICLPLA